MTDTTNTLNNDLSAPFRGTGGFIYTLHLADNALIMGQRNAEWCGHGPVLEEDIAMANISLDLIGQARLLYQHAAALQGEGAGEDRLAFFRDAREFRNYQLVELPHHGPLAATAAADRDYATTIVRNFLFSALMVLAWQALEDSADAQLAAIAQRALKETRYHLRHARDWLVRLGDGTEESHRRMQAALDHLLPYTQEFWTVAPHEAQAEEASSAGRQPGRSGAARRREARGGWSARPLAAGRRGCRRPRRQGRPRHQPDPPSPPTAHPPLANSANTRRSSELLLLWGALSLAGGAIVLSRGDASQLLQVRFVPGDLLMLLAASWLRRASLAALRLSHD